MIPNDNEMKFAVLGPVTEDRAWELFKNPAHYAQVISEQFLRL